ncbi:MAG TPA: hypothetical protein PLI09_05660 [Candidatus Hydrogenedentes bacterium]|nr:hypothetical protein [Candidatus Hydrogenedentota bacterium]
MKKMLVIALAVSLAVFMSFGAYAQAPATNDAAKATKAADPAAKTKPLVKKQAKANKPSTQVKGEVTGKIETKVVKNKKGEEKEACFIVVSSAKSADGKALDNLKGKKLRIATKQTADVKKLAGKEAVVMGTIINNRALKMESVKEAACAAAAPACTAAPAAEPKK